ncbi:HEPN/Toprim-associated domain-containing protein [Paraburkholderia phenoliruptrix]|uniref:HEPN/Toprim-associated domain-containing protein n=1 Tax=Paraburkholderia phenoliruptrix TaxID=252970 RepID=UPI002869D496|nr:HEPN/Toprim-associated domain-containing protein [Paraburkholderia phenoliruptrix]WMY10902.1 HEPN/Toprim-associated domain-containing protein [Paraburkholderia phenoliruptrix]
MEECVVHATIGGYPIASTVNRYNRWRFRPEDRIIRCRRSDQGNPLIHTMSTDKSDADVVEMQFVYSTTADTLRRRLGRAGFSRASLDKEFWDYYEKVVFMSDPGSLHFTGESAHAYSRAFSGTLDDWLDALAEAVKAGVTPARRAADGFTPTGNPLVDIITGPDKPAFEELEPEHGLIGFPCSSFNNMAVALLEVTAGNAVCELDVTSFVLHRGDITFDDMLGRRDEY